MKQERAIEIVKDMPNEFSVDELIERFTFIEMVEEGIRDVEEGRTIPHEEVKKMIEEWKK